MYIFAVAGGNTIEVTRKKHFISQIVPTKPEM